ncbi:MAG: hypothetical protein HQK81_09750 [Desulfovibrionaceae bacterium]|nr:hypothetical protein [Desulfovibrionaceae bacterium]MBF0514322.1 hypothetical protein [Desulfovibrionaceae bacterium]
MSLGSRVEKLEAAGRDGQPGMVWREQGETAEDAERRYLRENPGHKGDIMIVGWLE